jgi:hypothetical protein
LIAPQLSLAVVELHSSNSLDQAEARINLKRISMDSTNLYARTQARRELTMDALRFSDNSTALYYSKELVEMTNATFNDELLRLDALRITKDEGYSSALASYEREATTTPGKLSAMALWLMERRLPGQALTWLQGLPPDIETNVPAAVLVARCEIMLQNWAGLQNSVSKGNWGGLDYVRHAYTALALRQQGFAEASKAEWEVALTGANGQDSALQGLLQLAAEWNWDNEGEQILWTIVNKFPQEQRASQELMMVLYGTGNTRGLQDFFSLQAKRYPDDLNWQNDLAITAMLLHNQEIKPYDLASEVHQKNPTNGPFACTYAYSLYLQGKSADALKVMQQLTSKDLSNNSTAGYYGLILKANGQNDQAAAYLKRSVQGKLLPEERAMFQQAMTGL